MWWHESLPESVILIYPKQPMVEWVRSVRDDDERITLDSLRLYPNGIKVKSTRKVQTYEEFLIENIEGVFEVEFGYWVPDKEDWPGPRNWEMFRAWFDYQVIRSIYQIC